MWCEAEHLRWMKGGLKVLPPGAWLSHNLCRNLWLSRLHPHDTQLRDVRPLRSETHTAAQHGWVGGRAAPWRPRVTLKQRESRQPTGRGRVWLGVSALPPCLGKPLPALRSNR